MASTPDLADGATAHQNALAGCLPVDAPELDLGIVPAPVQNIGFGDPVGASRAGSILCIDGQIGAGSDLAGGQPAFRFELRAVETEGLVVIGEAERHAIGAGDAPAPGQCCCAASNPAVMAMSEEGAVSKLTTPVL